MRNPCWKLFTAAAPRARRMLLSGPPGTGKTHQAARSNLKPNQEVFSITTTEETPAAELRGFYQPSGPGKIDWVDGPVIQAWRNGGRLVLNEINKASQDCLTLFYAVLDDPDLARITLPTGETVKPHKDFTCIATMNGDPEDLPEALQDRFATKIVIDKIHPDALAVLPEELRGPAEEMSMLRDENRRTSIRAWMEFDMYRKELEDEHLAAELVFGVRAGDVLGVVRLRHNSPSERRRLRARPDYDDYRDDRDDDSDVPF